MALKFNGTTMGFGLRWYNTANGNVTEETYKYPYLTEVEFSRNVLKTKQRNLVIHPDHVPDKDGFWLNGYQADKDGRITFSTGVKDRFVISKNEIDFMFCTTDQSFASCYRLQNGTESSLKHMQKCPGIYIAYTTQENAKYIWNAKEYEHPKMSGRAFLYESNDKRHYTCGRPYGKTGFEIRDVLRRWLPNGLEIGWKLNEKQLALADFERDNFDGGYGGIIIHDRWDKTFDTDELYYKDGLKLKFNDGELYQKERMNMHTKLIMLQEKITKEKLRNMRDAELVAF